MHPFQIFNDEGRVVGFSRNHWYSFTRELFHQYPIQEDHPRLEITLFPYDGPRTIGVYYETGDWSTIFEVYSHVNPYVNEQDGLRCFVEEGHVNPWGEPIRLFSPLGRINYQIAYFRDKYWYIHCCIKHTQWSPNVEHYNFLSRMRIMRIRKMREVKSKVDWKEEGF